MYVPRSTDYALDVELRYQLNLLVLQGVEDATAECHNASGWGGWRPSSLWWGLVDTVGTSSVATERQQGGEQRVTDRRRWRRTPTPLN